ncbi:MAG: glycosyltransferase family 4 protein, partial [Candidatus Omnitrophica bacterium]|nr:glycosyltransferase family 4 protein [Candidatus Omnitrophota bacterium]
SENLEVKNKVIFTGNVPEDMLKSAIYSSDVVVIPSFYEPFGIVALEAMAYGKPIVASKVGGLKEFLTNNKTCLFFIPKDSESLARCIIKVLSNKSLSQKLGKNARDVVKNFDWNKIINKVIKIYREIYEKK